MTAQDVRPRIIDISLTSKAMGSRAWPFIDDDNVGVAYANDR